MGMLGVPTAKQYESDKDFWNDLAAQKYVDSLLEEENDISNVEYTEVCSSCDDDSPKIAKFQAGYAYGCYAGLWTCHAYSPVRSYLEDGESATQLLTVGNDHDWIDPLWLTSGNQRMNITYTETTTVQLQSTSIQYDPKGHVDSISSSNDVDTTTKPRVSNVHENSVVDIFWYVNNIR